MPYQYATTAETIKDVLSETTHEDDIETVGRILEAASAMIDRFTNRPSGYFAAVPPVDPEDDPLVYPTTVRRYRGTGTNFLQIGRHIPGTISVENVGSDLYYEHPENGWLYSVDVAGQAGAGVNDGLDGRFAPLRDRMFITGSLYLVTAAWGFAETPSDISFAAKQIAQHIWDRGRGIIGQISPTGFVIERDMPLTARTALTGWVRREFELN